MQASSSIRLEAPIWNISMISINLIHILNTHSLMAISQSRFTSTLSDNATKLSNKSILKFTVRFSITTILPISASIPLLVRWSKRVSSHSFSKTSRITSLSYTRILILSTSSVRKTSNMMPRPSKYCNPPLLGKNGSINVREHCS